MFRILLTKIRDGVRAVFAAPVASVMSVVAAPSLLAVHGRAVAALAAFGVMFAFLAGCGLHQRAFPERTHATELVKALPAKLKHWHTTWQVACDGSTCLAGVKGFSSSVGESYMFHICPTGSDKGEIRFVVLFAGGLKNDASAKMRWGEESPVVRKLWRTRGFLGYASDRHASIDVRRLQTEQFGPRDRLHLELFSSDHGPVIFEYPLAGSAEAIAKVDPRCVPN